MSGGFLPKVTAHATVALLLFLLVAGCARAATHPLHRWRSRGMLLLVCLGATGVRIHGLTMAGWWSGIVPGLSLPTLALLVHAGLRVSGHEGLFRSRDLRDLWWFGVLAGLLLYPAALGWGSWDPYAAGWSRSWVVLAAGALCVLALLQDRRLGVVLVAAAVAWRLGLLESQNYWDYLLDPLFVLLALGMGACLGM
ncbi:MAG: hypothetical protein J0L84_19835, partial [Verrucomicrobia bacterium]|nr:hypothetical protein [Verrucomicrobiota bacterium]